MAGSIPAGTLAIEIMANVARLQQDMARVKRAVGDMTTDVGRKVGVANDSLGKMGVGLARTGREARFAAHHMQNLAYQVNDVIVSLASGQRPLTVFMQQGSQIGQIMAQTGLSIGGAAKQMGSMTVSAARAHPVLTALAGAAATAGGAVLLTTREMNRERAAEIDAFVQSLGLTKEELEQLGDVGITAGDVFRGLWAYISEGLGLNEVFSSIRGWAVSAFDAVLSGGKIAAAGVYAAFRGTYDGFRAIWPNIGAILGEAVISGANVAIAALETLVNNAIRAINTLATVINPLLAVAKMAGINVGLPSVKFGRLANPYAGAGAAAGDAFANAYANAFRSAMSGMDRVGGEIGDAIFQTMKERVTNEAREKGLLDPKKAASGAGARRAVGRAGADAGDEWAKQFRRRAFEAPILAGNPQIELPNLLEEFAKEFAKAAEAAERLREEYAELAGVFLAMGRDGGKVLSGLSGLFGFLSGDYATIGGRTGATLELLSRMGGDPALRELGQVFTKSLDKFFGGEGEFTKAMMAGGVGMGVGGMVLGSKGSNLGSFAGGILGEKLGSKLLKPLGDFAGPVGTIIGGVLGGMLGSLVKKTKKASATIGIGADGLEISSVRGNSGSRKAASSQAAGSVIDALMAIAEQLGGDVSGPISVSIGVRKKSYRVDPTGRGITKTSKGAIDFGQDAEAAIKFAISDAIADGVITGLSASIQRLLKKGDIERQVEKAVTFKAALDEVRERTDPLGFALDKLAKEMERLASIAAEAGASEEELAQLRELGLRKQKDITEQARQDLLNEIGNRRALEIRILELLGRKGDALAAAREMELAALDASLRPLQQMVYQLEDARKVIETFGPLADDLRAYRAELLAGGTGGAQFLAGQFLSISARAAQGDAAALGQLREAAGSYLSSAMESAGSDVEYRRALSQVLAAVDRGIFAADAQADYAQAQIDAIERNANILTSIGDELAAKLAKIDEATAKVARLLERFEGDGLTVKTDADTPLYVVDATP